MLETVNSFVKNAVKEILVVKMLVKRNLIVMYATMFFSVKSCERKRNVMYVEKYFIGKSGISLFSL